MTATSPPTLASPAQLSELRTRLARSRTGPALSEAWDLGVPGLWLARLLTDWSRFDPAAVQARIDALEHCQIEVNGQQLHVCLAPGTGARALPLLLTNGWPSSFLEFLDLIPLLVATGGPAPGTGHDCFSVVIPALPGFGFSGPPAGAPLSGRRVAGLWHRLMTEQLGHLRYVAHGTDLGAGVTAWLARDYPDAVAGIHLGSPHLAPPQDPQTAAEAEFARVLRSWNAAEGGYAHLHASKPATVGAALLDSPVGMAAWIAEKFVAWSDADTRWESGAMRELLLATLTLYWTTATITTSMLPYWAHAHSGASLPSGDPSPVPTAVDLFGGERVPFPRPPRSLCERFFTVTRFGEHSGGGHFPAASAPQLLARALRDAFGVAPLT